MASGQNRTTAKSRLPVVDVEKSEERLVWREEIKDYAMTCGPLGAPPELSRRKAVGAHLIHVHLIQFQARRSVFSNLFGSNLKRL